MRLFIAEKPAIGKLIAETLGGGRSKGGYIECGDDVVTWCYGHLMELLNPDEINPAYSKWIKEDLPLKLRPHKLKPIARTADQFEVVARLISQADEIVHGGDPDDEGQLLVDELLEYCHNTAPVKRILINDPNVTAARKALNDLKDNNDYRGLYQKALARSVGDQLYGYNMTRAYTLAAREKGLDGVLSVGRVQTPVLALIVNRYLANKNHAAAFYYDVSGLMDFAGSQFKTKLKIPSDKGWELDDKGHLTDSIKAAWVAAECKGKPVTVISNSQTTKNDSAPLPFSLLNLQVKMSNLYGMSATQTLEITQKLREDHKAITYNRSDCNFLSEEQFLEAPAILTALSEVIQDYREISKSGAIDPTQKSRAFNNSKVTAHTAIIPTLNVPAKDKLSADQWKVYNAICMQYLAQFMPVKKTETCSVALNNYGYTFTTAASKTTQAGWTQWLSNTTDEEKEKDHSDSDFNLLASIPEGNQGVCVSTEVIDQKTKPLPLYTVATLLEDLLQVSKYVKDPRIKQLLIDRDEGKDEKEKGGIGTPATRGAVLDTLQERNFYRTEKKKLVPTELGISFIQQLPEIATAPDMTALWHEQQLMIEKGDMTVDSFLDALEEFIALQVAGAEVSGLKVAIHNCQCGGRYTKRKGVNGDFWGCSNYPECKNSAPDKKGAPDFTANVKPELSSGCPKCKARMAITPKMYACTGCDFRLFPEIFHKTLTLNQVDTLLGKGRTGIIKGFKKTAGGTFEAALLLNKQTWRVEPDFSAPKKTAKPKPFKRF